MLVFTQYVAMARLLRAPPRRAAASPTLFLHGGTPGRASGRRWWSGSRRARCRCSCCRSRPAGTGLNLTRADHVVHYDRWWNPAVEDQATDRAYRIGQTRPVQVHRLIAEGTVEDRIAELLASKRELADAVLGSGEAALTELSDASWPTSSRCGAPGMTESVGFPAFAPRAAHARRDCPGGAVAWIEAMEDAALEPGRLARGRTYAGAGRVGPITVSPGRHRGDVQGSRPRPYRTRLHPADPDRRAVGRVPRRGRRPRRAHGRAARRGHAARARRRGARGRGPAAARTRGPRPGAAAVPTGVTRASTPPRCATRPAGSSAQTRSCCC